MKLIRSYFSYFYHFMVHVEIRHGEEFHFPWFFLASILLPINLILLLILQETTLFAFLVFQVLPIMIISTLLSFFNRFKKWLRTQFSFERKRKIGFWEQVKGYILIYLVVLSPLLIVLVRLAYIVIKEGDY